MARFPKQLLMKQLRAKLWRLFYVTHSCKKPKFQADSSWEWEFLWNQYKKNVSVASMAFWFVINVQRQPFFFKQVAQSQLSRVCLDFRNRWKLTVSVTWAHGATVACKHGPRIEPRFTGNPTTRPKLCQLHVSTATHFWPEKLHMTSFARKLQWRTSNDWNSFCCNRIRQSSRQ